ncbi:group 3 secretory phospholipase A2 [Bufo bufo]|uniref:group 3 secretory phospholipase A2 n=1 Tax=Bufo bufo TaxID=8384 RepID=UPI001ABEDA54|nr:group 3 secretory phospholipase A2 [Bufo bufo]
MVWRSCVVVAVLFFIVLFTVNREKMKTRYRRSWIMPGTLWCGAGSTAENFTSLGVFSGVDRCCREHDHCSPQIQTFEFQYGIRNYRLHTVSHCDCDQRFRQCLHALNDAVSTLVGIVFFNILEMPCFSLREEEQCVEWHWWGGCKKNGSVPKAELQKPEIFNYSNPEDRRTSIPIPHSLHPHNVTSPPQQRLNAKSRRRRLKRLQREQSKRDNKGILKDSNKAEEKPKILNVKSKLFTKH